MRHTDHKRFSRLKTDEGFDRRYVFHSIRKTVITLLGNADAPWGIIAELVGHEFPSFTEREYFGGATMERKRDAIEKLSYPTHAPTKADAAG